MPYITEQEAKHFEALRNAEREQEEAHEIDFSEYDLTTLEGSVAAREAISKLPAGVQETWTHRMTAAAEEQVERAEDAESLPAGGLSEDARAAFHEELAAAKTQEDATKVLAKFGQLDEG